MGVRTYNDFTSKIAAAKQQVDAKAKAAIDQVKIAEDYARSTIDRSKAVQKDLDDARQVIAQVRKLRSDVDSLQSEVEGFYRIASDLHSELWPENFSKAARRIDLLFPPLPDDPVTTLLLAGDTGSYRRRNLYGAVISYLCDRFFQVFDVPGNHYWYGGTDWNLCKKPVARPNYHFGHMLSVGPVVACTLWADFQRGDPLVEQQCAQGMNDFRQVPGLTPLLVKERHAEHLEFLWRTIKPGDVVMTHFAPSWRSVHDRYRHDPCNGYYASDIEDLIVSTKPSLWVHGHIHHRSTYTVGATQVICNPAGYDGRGHDPYLAVMSAGAPPAVT